MCIFKALHKFPEDHYHGLNLEEFQRFYEVIDFKWEQVTVQQNISPASACSPALGRDFLLLSGFVLLFVVSR